MSDSFFGRLRDFVGRREYAAQVEENEKSLSLQKPTESTEVIISAVSPSNRSNPPRRGGRQVAVAYDDVPRFRAPVERIADAVAATPFEAWYVGRSPTDRGARPIPKMAPWSKATLDKYRVKAEKEGTLIELDSHPLLDLLDTGNHLLDGYSCAKVCSIWYDSVGEWFQMIELDESTGKPRYLWPIPPSWVQDTPHAGQPFYMLNTPAGRQKLPAELMLYCRNVSPTNPYGRGSGMGYALGDEIDIDEYAATVIKTAFQNNGLPFSLIQVAGMGEKGAKDLEKQWFSQYGGPRKSNRTRFVGGDSIKQVVLDQPFKNLQMAEMRDAQRDIITQSFGLPPELLGIIENSNRATIEAADYLMQVYVVQPRMDAFRRVYQRYLVGWWDERLIIDFPLASRHDKDRQVEVMKAAPYHFTRNQWQVMAGLDDIGEEGDVYLQPLNLMEVRQGEEPPEMDNEEPSEEPTEEPEDMGEEYQASHSTGGIRAVPDIAQYRNTEKKKSKKPSLKRKC